MWEDAQVTREELDGFVAMARDEGAFIAAAPFTDAVMEALSELAASFPNPTKELVDAVYKAFDN